MLNFRFRRRRRRRNGRFRVEFFYRGKRKEQRQSNRSHHLFSHRFLSSSFFKARSRSPRIKLKSAILKRNFIPPFQFTIKTCVTIFLLNRDGRSKFPIRLFLNTSNRFEGNSREKVLTPLSLSLSAKQPKQAFVSSCPDVSKVFNRGRLRAINTFGVPSLSRTTRL